MKIKLFLSLQILVLISCNSYKTDSEPWEGISENIMKITISEYFPFEENAGNDYIKSQIKGKLDQRASLIIASYISINLLRNKISHDTDVTLNNLINETITKGKLLNFNCSENNYCTAYGEYNITELQKNLKIINNQ